jgi:CubicO group peptidase (beta-lactamase class C family)
VHPLALVALLGLAARAAPATATLAPLPRVSDDFSASFAPGSAEEAGIDPKRLVALTRYLRESPAPIFSVLISRHGKLVYEAYSSSAGRDEAHYVMSVTKSVVSALVGIALEQKLVKDTGQTVAQALPREFFASDADVERFGKVTLRDVMGMSALDAPVPPERKTKDARERLLGFWACKDRVRFALSQPLLPEPGRDFEYNDLTPMIAVGVLEHAAGMSALDFAQAHLFAPLRFKNVEWMHQDPTGFDNAGFGLRLRPIDMQKLGVLYLRQGDWDGRQLIAREWVERSFSPWIKSRPGFTAPNYGWFWWELRFAGWTAHVASGWKGQRIAVIPEQDMVVTMTAAIEVGDEDEIFATLMREFVIPATAQKPLEADAGARTELAALLDALRRQTRIGPKTEERMIPSVAPKGAHRSYSAK